MSKWMVVGILGTLAACNGQTVALGGAIGADAPTSVSTSTISPIITPSGTLERAEKVDLLLMIDNSGSMGDKQELLRRSVPDLVTRLVQPNCIDAAGHVLGASVAGACAAGKLEFAPVTDLHVGVLTSSLGGRGGDLCPAGQTIGEGHLVTFTAQGYAVHDAAAGFLSYGAGHITDPARLSDDVGLLVGGVGTRGCGLEAQLESWYRFLVEPDPSPSVDIDPTGHPRMTQALDTTVLRQRHDFLRPDSLLTIIMLTDEDDASVDPLAVGGQGWAFVNSTFPGSTQKRADGRSTTAPRGTSVCKTDPLAGGLSPKDVDASVCTSCSFAASCDASLAACQSLRADPACSDNHGYYRSDEEDLEYRFFHMKERFGVDPQFPISRYVQGLLSARVPSRTSAHDEDGNYLGPATCQNPIFASALPSAPSEELCDLPPGPRSQRTVVFHVIGGAPPALAHPNMSEADWVALVGSDPSKYAYDGADLHMLQSVNERPGLPDSSAPSDADPVHGREHAGRNDLQYACTFPLDAPRECDAQSGDCDCANPLNASSPICDPVHPSTQVAAKAYPSIRPFQVARLVGEAGVVASICPPRAAGVPPSNPSFGYRPAMANLGDRMSRSLILAP